MNMVQKAKGFFSNLWSDNSGQGLVEYALILALIACAVVVALSVLGGSVSGLFDAISETISDAI